MANAPTPQHKDQPKHDERGDDAHQQGAQQQGRGPDADKIREERAKEARRIFDDNEKAAEDEDFPVTSQTDQLVRSMEMEQVGPTAWMNEMERRIAERQGDAPAEPRQVHGVVLGAAAALMSNIYDWQVGPNGELINTGSPDYGAPPPAKPSWYPPDRISSGVNAPSPSLLSGAGSSSNMGYPALGTTLNTGGPDSGLDQSAPPTAAPNPGGSIDFSKLLSSINPISSAEAATLPQKQPYGPQVPPGGLPGQQPGALVGAFNNIRGGSAAALAAAHRAANGWGQQISDAGAIEGGNPAVALPVKSGQNPAPTLPQPNYHMPWPRAQVPPQAGGGAPQGGGGPSSYGSPWDPQGAGYAAAQRLAQQQQGSPWDPQGVGYAASQRLAQRAPVQGPLAALGQQPNSPFTMVLRPNAPAESGGRGQGGSPLSTALDLSGYQPPPPPAPSSYNLGYGGGGRGGGGRGGGAPAPSRMRAQAPQDPGSAFWSTSGQGVGLPALHGNGFYNIFGTGVGFPKAGGGFYNTFGPGVGMPSPGPVNQPGFLGVHGRGVGFSGNQ